MNFRVRSKAGLVNLRAIPAETTLVQLLKILQENTQIQWNHIKIKSGFPPKEISGNGSEVIGKLMTNGDTLNIEYSEVPLFEKEESVNSQVTPSPSPQPQQPPPQQSQPQQQLPTPQGNEQQPKGPELMTIADGCALKRVIPDDNSCLFHAIAYVLDNKTDNVMKLRKIISNAIASDPSYFNEGILGKKNYDYQKYIEQPNTWGGSVELNIFSDYFKTEIMAYDVTRKRGNCFGESKYSQRVYLLYDGIHYDVLVWNLVPSSPQSDFDVTVFNSKDAAIEREFIKLMEKEHASGKYVDEYNYTLQCLQCGQKFVGNTAAVAHAKATQHDQFGQASN